MHLLILDEVISSFLTQTEELIQKAPWTFWEKDAFFVSVPTASIIRNADLILVMKDGNIIEHRANEELMAQGGFYADFCTIVFTEYEKQE